MLMSGKEYLQSIRDGRVIYIGKERVGDQTTHPAFASDGRLHRGDKFRERADVHADCVATCGKRFYEGCPAADMVIENQVSYFSERLDRRAGEGWRKTCRIFIEAVRQATYGLGIARAGDQRDFKCSR
jgi:hypothetical protein